MALKEEPKEKMGSVPALQPVTLSRHAAGDFSGTNRVIYFAFLPDAVLKTVHKKMLQLTSLISIVKRLKAALQLVTLAQIVIPQLVASGRTDDDSATTILQQIPALRAEIEEQIKIAAQAMETIQDRVESIAQFLLFHRGALTPTQSAQLDEHWATLKG